MRPASRRAPPLPPPHLAPPHLAPRPLAPRPLPPRPLPPRHLQIRLRRIWQASLQLLASLPAAASPSATPREYRDTAFSFGTVYLYSVRSIISYGADQVESDDSNLITVNAKDIFPPVAPQSLVGVVTPTANGMPAYIELTWGINSEPDLAGYIVYRSDAADAPGMRVNPELLPAPAFRDDAVQPGRRYFYHVTAVDQAGNESAPSATIDVALP